MRLNCLSKSEIVLDSPYFESQTFPFEDPNEMREHDVIQVQNDKESTTSGFQNIASPSEAQSSSFEIEKGDYAGIITAETVYREARSPSSDDLQNPSSENRPDSQEMLEEIAQYLLSDTQFTTTSDEKSLMSRVNSLCYLLRKDGTTGTNSQSKGETCDEFDGKNCSWECQEKTHLGSCCFIFPELHHSQSSCLTFQKMGKEANKIVFLFINCIK